jgi:hypothetical protein
MAAGLEAELIDHAEAQATLPADWSTCSVKSAPRRASDRDMTPRAVVASYRHDAAAPGREIRHGHRLGRHYAEAGAGGRCDH